jgi:hypothetical protein
MRFMDIPPFERNIEIPDFEFFMRSRLNQADEAHKDLQAMTISELEAYIRIAEANIKDVTPEATVEDENDGTPQPADDAPPQTQ